MALFTSTVASDIAFLNSAQMQWSNFSAWLNAGALLFGAPVLLWAIVEVFLARHRAARRPRTIYAVLLGLMWICGLANAFWHSRDAWASVETTGLVLSIITAVLALAAAWMAFARRSSGETA